MTQSMSRVGRCLDNSVMEGFWGIIKSEMYHLHEFTDEDTLRKAIEDYLQFYKNERIQERFGGKAPAEVRQEALVAESPTQYPIPINKRIQKFKKRIARSII